MAVKLDMSKGYDHVKWNYFRLMILHMGFHQRWVNLIMSCVSLVTNIVLVNGTPTKIITPSRGVRQGDHCRLILPYMC